MNSINRSPTSPVSPVAGSPASSSGRRRPSHRPHGEDPSTEHLCRYPSKLCYNTRALKRDGEWHNLCEFHRARANDNQRRLEQKRKNAGVWACTSGENMMNNASTHQHSYQLNQQVMQGHFQQSRGRTLESLVRLESMEDSMMDAAFATYDAPLFDPMDAEFLDSLIGDVIPVNPAIVNRDFAILS